jgi:hypothetical protein
MTLMSASTSGATFFLAWLCWSRGEQQPSVRVHWKLLAPAFRQPAPVFGPADGSQQQRTEVLIV